MIAAILQGCRAGKNYKGTDFTQPTSYRQDTKTNAAVAYDTVNTDSLTINTADIRWWELFDDPVLDSLITEAFENNRNALIASESVMQSRFALKIQNAEFLPKFSANGQFSRGNFVMNQLGSTNNLKRQA